MPVIGLKAMTLIQLDLDSVQAPASPGVYKMVNASGQIIYVGKAKNLQKRLSSYFRKNLDREKTRVLMSQVASIDVIITANEFEALLLESDLIKQHHPRYNILLRDDKSYPYLFLSTEHEFPRLDMHRGSKKAKGRYFGPYPNARAVRDNLLFIQKLFLLRQCRDTFFANRSRPCLQYQIKRCTAPCVDYVTKQDYAQQVEYASLFLEGKNNFIIDALQKKMDQASGCRQYEKAALYRDQIAQLRYIQSKQVAVGGADNVDVIAVGQKEQYFGVVILYVRAAKLLGHKVFFPKAPKGSSCSEVLSAFVAQYYCNPVHQHDQLDKIVVNERLEEKSWLVSALQEEFGKRFALIDRKHKVYDSWCQMASTNLQHALIKKVSDKQSVFYKLQSLQKLLGIEESIKRIECFDVSHTQGESTIASCVVYGEQGALNQEYRRFNINNITAGDDYAAMRQVLLRRYEKQKKDEAVLPDIVMIDGGKGQLKQAEAVFEELQLTDVVLMSVAKGVARKPGLEKIWLSAQTHPIQLAADSDVLHLIQFIRDESHRFAITSHRKKRTKQSFSSPLDAIAGVGAKRRSALLRHFSGQRGLQAASVSEIAAVPGISRKLAQHIYDSLHE